ncbi:MAG: reverse transcriptase-like protein [Anaerolineales bacterium]
MPAPTLQQLLETIAALPAPERTELLARLRDIYGQPAPAPVRQIGLDLSAGDWSGPADYLIIFDGGSLGNPGVGYGSFAVFAGSEPGKVQRLEFPGSLTNNEAEYLTLLAALRRLAETLGAQAGQTSVEIRGDSQLVIQQVQGHWKAKDERMRRLREEVRAALRPFARTRLVQQPREHSVRVLGH